MAITAFETSGAITTGDSTDKASPAGPSRAPASRRRNWGSSASPSWVATVTEGGVTSLSTRSLGQFACRARSSYVLLKFKCETSSLDYDQFTFLRLCNIAEQSKLIFLLLITVHSGKNPRISEIYWTRTLSNNPWIVMIL